MTNTGTSTSQEESRRILDHFVGEMAGHRCPHAEAKAAVFDEAAKATGGTPNQVV